mmetsp:Transcript_50719/g.156581  ORF Transcript_50719/g.156581 Transcript_50719/m.156581 type:complete len:218 (+) Transcript_50719:116-769(+)
MRCGLGQRLRWFCRRPCRPQASAHWADDEFGDEDHRREREAGQPRDGVTAPRGPPRCEKRLQLVVAGRGGRGGGVAQRGLFHLFEFAHGECDVGRGRDAALDAEEGRERHRDCARPVPDEVARRALVGERARSPRAAATRDARRRGRSGRRDMRRRQRRRDGRRGDRRGCRRGQTGDEGHSDGADDARGVHSQQQCRGGADGCGSDGVRGGCSRAGS